MQLYVCTLLAVYSRGYIKGKGGVEYVQASRRDWRFGPRLHLCENRVRIGYWCRDMRAWRAGYMYEPPAYKRILYISNPLSPGACCGGYSLSTRSRRDSTYNWRRVPWRRPTLASDFFILPQQQQQQQHPFAGHRWQNTALYYPRTKNLSIIKRRDPIIRSLLAFGFRAN